MRLYYRFRIRLRLFRLCRIRLLFYWRYGILLWLYRLLSCDFRSGLDNIRLHCWFTFKYIRLRIGWSGWIHFQGEEFLDGPIGLQSLSGSDIYQADSSISSGGQLGDDSERPVDPLLITIAHQYDLI